MKLAIAGVGNNTSALLQGIALWRNEPNAHLTGVARPSLGGIRVSDVEVVATFDVSPDKVGLTLTDAIFATPNNFPTLGVDLPKDSPKVSFGISDPTDTTQLANVAAVLRDQEAEVLLYSLPTGLPEIARAYAEVAIAEGIAIVNCTPDPIAGLPNLLEAAKAKRIPVVGDDLQSQVGSSVVHGALLALLQERGITLTGSYQLNCGGNADFANLRLKGKGKEFSKHNALRQRVNDTKLVTVVPSAGFIPHLQDRKIGHISIEGQGWAGTPVKLEITLSVQDSSNAAGVIIDLIRIAAAARRQGEGGFPVAATHLLKSPPIQKDVHHHAVQPETLADSMTDAKA